MEAINWTQLGIITLINLGIGTLFGLAFATWDNKRNKNMQRHMDLQRDLNNFRSEYNMALARVRRENNRLANRRRADK